MTLTDWRHRLPPSLVLACFVILALAFGLVVPPFENLDEVEHFEVVRYITDTGQLPVHGPATAEVYHYRQEASQPPLYHLLSAGLVRLLGLEADDVAIAWRLNPCVACGPGAASLYDNRAVFYHNPNQEAFPWQGTLLTLHVLRMWSTLLQVVTVIGTYVLARLAFPQRRKVGLVAMAVVAFNPQFLLVASGVNNDNLVTPLVTLGLCLLLWTWRNGLSARRAVGLGVLAGLAGLTKLSGWLLLPLSVTIILILTYRPTTLKTPSATRDSARPLRPTFAIRNSSFVIGHLLLVILTALAVSGWWFWRNWQFYQDPTALQPMLELVGTRGGSLLQSFLEAGAMFRSFWGQIPCSFYPLAFYAFYAVLTALALGGLAWGWRRLASTERIAGMIFSGWFLLVVVSWMRWNAMTPAPGGRLLFPALPAVAMLMALGIDGLTQGRLKYGNGIVIGLLALLAWWTALQILPNFFAPPPRYPDASAIHPDRPLDATLGEFIQVRGYDVALDSGADDGADNEPTLDVTLYWQARAPIIENYVMALQLVSPVLGDTTLRWNYNSWPGRGNYPTSAWQPGEVIVDRYRFHLPEADFPTRAWDVHVALYRRETGERLPVQVSGVDAGDRLVLTRLRVPGVQPLCLEEGRMISEVRFGEAVALTHAVVVPEQDGSRVELCWKALQPLATDYTVFVHLLDASGVLVATGDGLPMQGAFPTSMWRSGDIVLDVHRLTSVSGIEEQSRRIAIGLYKPGDGSRLPAYVGDVSIPDAAVQVWPNHP